MIKSNLLQRMFIVPTFISTLFVGNAFPGADPSDPKNRIEVQSPNQIKIELPNLIKAYRSKDNLPKPKFPKLNKVEANSSGQVEAKSPNGMQKTLLRLRRAIEAGNLEEVKNICSKSPKCVSTPDEYKNQALHYAAKSLHENALLIVEYLLWDVKDVTADSIISAFGDCDYTPLDYAYQYGLPEVKEYLTTYGGERTIVSDNEEENEEEEEEDSEFEGNLSENDSSEEADE